MRKVAAIFTILIVSGLLAGCSVSKSSYEDRMTKILEGTKEKLEKSVAANQGQKGSKAQEKKGKDSAEEQIDILKEAKKKIERINPPDDFFSGHSDLIEFIGLFITVKEKQIELQGIRSEDKEKNQERTQIQQEVFEAYQGGLTALSRASRELPFLEFEIRQSFKSLLQGGQPTPGFPGGPGSLENLQRSPGR